jgi:hypothetical protein
MGYVTPVPSFVVSSDQVQSLVRMHLDSKMTYCRICLDKLSEVVQSFKDHRWPIKAKQQINSWTQPELEIKNGQTTFYFIFSDSADSSQWWRRYPRIRWWMQTRSLTGVPFFRHEVHLLNALRTPLNWFCWWLQGNAPSNNFSRRSFIALGIGHALCLLLITAVNRNQHQNSVLLLSKIPERTQVGLGAGMPSWIEFFLLTSIIFCRACWDMKPIRMPV